MAISAFSKGLICVTDLINAADSLNRYWSGEIQGNDLQTALLVNRLVILGFDSVEFACFQLNTGAGKLQALKTLEFAARSLNLTISFSEQAQKVDGTARSYLTLLTKGVIEPASQLIRTGAELKFYEEKKYLEQWEASHDAKRPIYKFDAEGDPEIVGWIPIDPAQCRQAMGQAAQIGESALFTGLLAQSPTLEQGTDLSASLYQRLSNWLHFHIQGQAAPAAAAAAAAPIPPADVLFNLLAFPRIPEILHNDAVFSQNICPITHQPIRDPVRDPTNHMTIYERSAIENWFQVARQRRSPMTQQIMGPLEEMPALKLQIDNRLRLHQTRLEQFLAQPPAEEQEF